MVKQEPLVVQIMIGNVRNETTGKLSFLPSELVRILAKANDEGIPPFFPLMNVYCDLKKTEYSLASLLANQYVWARRNPSCWYVQVVSK